MNRNEVNITLVTDASGMVTGFKTAEGQVASFGTKTKEAVDGVSGHLKRLWNDVDTFKLKMNGVEHTLKGMMDVGTFIGIVKGSMAAVNAAENMENSLRGLAATARYAGENIGDTMKKGTDLANDGLINVQASSQSLQNLLARGFSLDQSVQIIERLKDAAAFNRQSHLSMSDAVKSATEGLKNENSILVDNAGVTKNVSVMWKEYSVQIGKSVNDLTQAEKRQAEYTGILKETEGQLGNAKLATEGLTGAKAKLETEAMKLKVSLGESLAPAFLELAKAGVWTLDNMVKPFIGGLEIMATKTVDTWDKMKLTFKAPFMDKEEFHKQWKALDQAFNEQVKEIIEKWDGAFKTPTLGVDSEKRREDAGTPDKPAKESDLMKSLREEDAKDLHERWTVQSKYADQSWDEQLGRRKKESELREKSHSEEIEALGAHNKEIASFYEGLSSETLEMQKTQYGDWWALAVDYAAKEEELHRLGIENKDALNEWYVMRAGELSRKETDEAVKEAQRNVTAQKQAEQTIYNMKLQTFSLAAGLLRSLGAQSQEAAIAAIVIEKGLAMASVMVNSQAAKFQAMASIPYPASLGAVAQIEAMTAMSLGIIAAQGVMEAVSVGSGGASAGSPGGQPIETRDVGGGRGETTQEPRETRQIVINIHGNVVDHAAFVRELAPYIEEAKGDRISFGR